jgi:hypothetical protein
LDSCNAGYRQHVSFGGFASAEELDGCGCATDFAFSYGSAQLRKLWTDIHHGGAAFSIEMGKTFHQTMVGRTSLGERASHPG